MSQTSTINTRGYKKVILTKSEYDKQNSVKTSWSLVKYDGKSLKNFQNLFYIENVYLDERPKLISSIQDPATYSNLISTNREKDGYTQDGKNVWQIVEAKKDA